MSRRIGFYFILFFLFPLPGCGPVSNRGSSIDADSGQEFPFDDTSEFSEVGEGSEEIVMMGELIFGMDVSNHISSDQFGHGYNFYPVENIKVTVYIKTAPSLSTLMRVIDSGDNLIQEFEVGGGEEVIGPQITIGDGGTYQLLILNGAHVDGDYTVRIDCIEGCESGICPEPADHIAPPAGKRLKLLRDEEIAVVDVGYSGGYYVDFYTAGTDGYQGSRQFNAPSGVVDIASGNINDKRGEMIVLLPENSGRSDTIIVADPLGDSSVEGTYVLSGSSGAVALDCEDINWDGIDEVFLLEEYGDVSMVVFPPHEAPLQLGLFLSFASFVSAKDICAGDIDGDGTREIFVLYEGSSGFRIAVISVEEGGDAQIIEYIDLDDSYEKCELADLDADLKEELILLHDGGFWGSDTISIFKTDSEGTLQETVHFHDAMRGDVIGLATADLEGEFTSTIMLLTESKQVLKFIYDSSRESILLAGTFSVSATTTASMITGIDFDGDSPFMELDSGPFMVKTRMRPIVLVFYPPSWGGSSEYYSEVSFGEDTFEQDRLKKNIGFSANASIGYKGEIPGLFGYNVKAQVKYAVNYTTQEWSKLQKGYNYTLKATSAPHSAGGILMEWTCYDGYIYNIYDPANMLGGDRGNQVSVIVPRHVGNVLWNLDRFNAVSSQLDLPQINPGIVGGDPSSYPNSMVDVFGNPVSTDDLVTPDPFIFGVSDSSRISAFYRMEEIRINEEAISTGFNISGGVSVGPVSFDAFAGIDASWTHSLWIGHSTKFAFKVCPIPDVTETPVDEYFNYYYEFSPFIYKYSEGDVAYYAIYYYVTSLGPGY